MASKKKKTTKKKGKDSKKNEELEELRTMLQGLKEEVETMHKTIKKQSKRISSLETDNKRFKKALRKIELGGGYDSSNNNLLSPQSSQTIATDVEQSDNESQISHDAESKEDSDSKDLEQTKSKAKAKAKARPRSVVRRNKPKPKKKAADVKFTFDMSHQKIKAGDNGSVAIKPKVYGGTIRFGRYVNYQKNNSDNIAVYKVIFDTRSIGQNSSTALGFATQAFGDWIGSNFGQNNCCLVKGNSQFVTTDKIFKLIEGKEYKHKQEIPALKNADNPNDGFFKDSDDVAVEMDFKNSIGRIWNESTNKDGEDKSKVFEIGLPTDYEVCIVAYMGGSQKKRLAVKDQSVVIDEQE